MFFKPRPACIALRYAARLSSDTKSRFKVEKPRPLNDPAVLAKIAGIFACTMIPTMGMFLFLKQKQDYKIIAASAPMHLKDKNNPKRLIIEGSELEPYGENAGIHGRSNPKKKQHKSTGLIGFLKTSAEGREGLLNELIYHRLAEKIFGDLHPQVKLVENKIENTGLSEYALYIESIGSNVDLKTYAEDQMAAQNSQEVLPQLTIDNLGRAVAFATLIRSSDSYMKNHIIRTEKELTAYPIDFELIDSSKPILFVDFTVAPDLAATYLIKKGGIMDYQTVSSLNQLEQKRIRAGGDTEAGTGHKKYGSLIYDLLKRSCLRDIENGQILDMYRNISVIEDSDIDDIVDECRTVMTPEEVLFYKTTLRELVSKTKEYVEKLENSSQPKLSQPK